MYSRNGPCSSGLDTVSDEIIVVGVGVFSTDSSTSFCETLSGIQFVEMSE